MGRRPIQTLLQRRYRDGQQTHDKLLTIAKYQRNTNQNQNFLTLVRMAIIKNSTNTSIFQLKKKNCRNSKYWRGCREKGTLLHCQWESKLEQPLKRTLWRFLKKLKIELHVILQSHSWAYIQRKICLQKAHAPQYSI